MLGWWPNIKTTLVQPGQGAERMPEISVQNPPPPPPLTTTTTMYRITDLYQDLV